MIILPLAAIAAVCVMFGIVVHRWNAADEQHEKAIGDLRKEYRAAAEAAREAAVRAEQEEQAEGGNPEQQQSPRPYQRTAFERDLEKTVWGTEPDATIFVAEHGGDVVVVPCEDFQLHGYHPFAFGGGVHRYPMFRQPRTRFPGKPSDKPTASN